MAGRAPALGDRGIVIHDVGHDVGHDAFVAQHLRLVFGTGGAVDHPALRD
ncbi:MAG: hypothetical protein VXW43_13865 [Pseudomonadota bacterium]|nr:hypothetical protein [Pseudomonadota bacterium]